MKKPYIRKFDTVSGFTVWLVDGRQIRATLDLEFTNFGQHHRYHFIPPDEFWIDFEQVPGDAPFYVHHLLIEYRLMSGGMAYEMALERANLAEKRKRRLVDFRQKGICIDRRADTMPLVRKRLLKSYSQHLQVWIVSGRAVRGLLFIDFTLGGHDKVYRFIRPGEIWLDDDVSPRERKFILLHELHERYLMAHGMGYQNAHEESNRLEKHCRNNPVEIDRHLRKAIRNNKAA